MLSPAQCALEPAEREAWSRHYCGLCHSVGASFGQGMRLVHSHDAVFVSVLADALTEEAAATCTGRCPLVPITTVALADPGSPPLLFAGSAQVHIADQWLADKEAEGHLLGMGRPALRGPAARAWRILNDLGVSLQHHATIAVDQARLEHGEAGPEEAAEPTARALADAFAELGCLAGSVAGHATHQEQLRQLGHAIGRTIYLVDALEDLDEDLRSGSFNPCLHRGRGTAHPDPDRLAACEDVLKKDRARIHAALERLPLQRHRSLVEHILQTRLAGRADDALVRARTQSTAISISPWPAHARVQHAFFAFCLTVWAWFLSVPSALAATTPLAPLASNQCSGNTDSCPWCCCKICAEAVVNGKCDL